jgi:hypothetical protein
MQNFNPLAKNFRQPAVFVKLPSQGQYYPPDTLMLPANGEVGIMPMTAKDEILLRTPDALMNGQGVVSVIESCVPAIQNAWALPTIDLDMLLMAIRIATYGNGMDIDSNCPKCKHDNRHQVDLGTLITRIGTPNYKETVNIDGLTIKFKPLSYLQSNSNNIIKFEEQRIIDLLNREDMEPEARKAQFDVHIKKIVDNNTNIIAKSTESITTESGEIVTDPNFISEYYYNSSNKVIKQVQSKLQEIAKSSNLPAATVMCEACETTYDVEITFDYGNFFEPLS